MNKQLKYLNQTPITSKPESQQSLSSSSASIISNRQATTALKSPPQQQQQQNINNSKFYQTFKTLFDIFDPEQRGYIDINELELLGANQNEILNDIINYLKRNQNITNFVTFNTFVNAADIILKKRKMVKTQLKQNYKKTLSEEFDQQKLQLQQLQQHQNSQIVDNQTVSTKLNNEPFILQNANSFDLNMLLEQENCLLNDGLIELNKLKIFFEQKINENRLKKMNILKLKHQNLFSIDKMLLNLNEVNNLNKFLNTFNQNNNSWMENNENNNSFDDDLNTLLKAAQITPPTPSSIINNNSGTINVFYYDRFIKEKQERIDNLQKEKSNLIRKLFEIKSRMNGNERIEVQDINETKDEDYLFQ